MSWRECPVTWGQLEAILVGLTGGESDQAHWSAKVSLAISQAINVALAPTMAQIQALDERIGKTDTDLSQKIGDIGIRIDNLPRSDEFRRQMREEDSRGTRKYLEQKMESVQELLAGMLGLEQKDVSILAERIIRLSVLQGVNARDWMSRLTDWFEKEVVKMAEAIETLLLKTPKASKIDTRAHGKRLVILGLEPSVTTVRSVLEKDADFEGLLRKRGLSAD